MLADVMTKLIAVRHQIDDEIKAKSPHTERLRHIDHSLGQMLIDVRHALNEEDPPGDRRLFEDICE